MSELTQERLKELLHYAPDTGVFTWISGPRRTKTAGCLQRVGYLVVRLDGTLYYLHRLALLYMDGEWPGMVDHVNGERADNRWSNLRQCSAEVNAQNKRKAYSSKLYDLPLGVTWAARRGKYMAQIGHAGKNKALGYFSCPQEAHQAYLIAKRELHAGCTI